LNNPTRVTHQTVFRSQPAVRPLRYAGRQESGDAAQPMVVLASLAGAVLVFTRISMFSEMLALTTGINLYVLYLTAIPACFALVVTGGLKRAFRGAPAYCWLGYMGWIALSTPFSSWRGDSTHMVIDYLRTNIPMLFVVAGLAATWRTCKWMMYAVAWGAVANLLASRLFMKEYNGRAGLALGSVGNPNDFAAHLLLVLPFLLWIATSSKWVVLRLGALLGVGYGTYLILSTGSRGALIGLGVDALFFLWKGTLKQRLALVVVLPVAAATMLALMPAATLSRLGSFFAASSLQEAQASTDSRRYLMGKGIEYTLKFPVFGVGAGQFPNYEGMNSAVIGTHGSFHGTHNTFLQASAECGIPALLFMLAGVIATFRLLYGTFKEARNRPDCQDIRNCTFYMILGVGGFCAAIFFLNFAYMYYFPMMGGLAVAVRSAARDEFRIRQRAASTSPSNAS